MPTLEQQVLFARFAGDFLGLNSPTGRIYLDAAATSLMSGVAMRAMHEYLRTACSNPHTLAHDAGRASGEAIEQARAIVGDFLDADPLRDVVLFTGNGSTGAINRLARALFPRGPGNDRPYVVVSQLEHHSNWLPWERAVGQSNLIVAPITADGSLDLDVLREILTAHGPRIRVVAVTAASNVTGVMPPIGVIADMAHRVGALIAVDAAQGAPHTPIDMHPAVGAPLDAVALSGHKLFVPGSPGVLVVRRDLLEHEAIAGDVGGGVVETVTMDYVQYLDDLPAREEAGTPNTMGIVGLGAAVGAAQAIGMDMIRLHDQAIMSRCMQRMRVIDRIKIYGPEYGPRVGVISFNVDGTPHEVIAAALADCCNIDVRDGCFCAQPYVRQLLGRDGPPPPGCNGRPPERPGMVRVSFGPWNTLDDVDTLTTALEGIVADSARLCTSFNPDAVGRPQCFSLDDQVRAWVSG